MRWLTGRRRWRSVRRCCGATRPTPSPTPPLPPAEPLPAPNELIAAALSGPRGPRHRSQDPTSGRVAQPSAGEPRGAPRRPGRDPTRADSRTRHVAAERARRATASGRVRRPSARRRASRLEGLGRRGDDQRPAARVVAGGLRRWLEERHGSIGRLRVQVPVSMHREGEAPGAVPNRDSFVNIDLPVQEADAARRAGRQRADAGAEAGSRRRAALRGLRGRRSGVEAPVRPRAPHRVEPARSRSPSPTCAVPQARSTSPEGRSEMCTRWPRSPRTTRSG